MLKGPGEHMAQWITSIDHILLKDSALEIPVAGGRLSTIRGTKQQTLQKSVFSVNCLVWEIQLGAKLNPRCLWL